MLDKLLEDLRKNKRKYLNAKEGSEFENRVATFLNTKMGLTKILKDDLSQEEWMTIKQHLGDKLGAVFLDLPNGIPKNTFIYQPCGSQDFSDFLIFTSHKVIPLEIKFSGQKQKSPMWNSNVPKANAFYIFGSYGASDVTFFCGNDVLSAAHRAALYSFFKKIKKLEEDIRTTMPGLDDTNRGFTPYIRAAFAQQKHKSSVQTNFFTHPERQAVEDNAITLAKSL
jgi:hypothetical protein